MQFGEQLWLKREPRRWRAPSRPKVLAQYLLLWRRAQQIRQDADAKNKADGKLKKKTSIAG